MIRLVMCWLALVLMSAVVDAASLQYRLDNGNITGVTDEPIGEVPERGVVTIPEPMSAIVWPVPTVVYTGSPGTCPAGTGQQIWTRIADPAAVTVSGGGMDIQADYAGFFFTSSVPLVFPGCHVVFSKDALAAHGQAELHRILNANPFAMIFNEFNVITQLVVCPTGNDTAPCPAIRTKQANLNATASVYPATASGWDTFLGHVQTFRNNVQDFNVAKGW